MANLLELPIEDAINPETEEHTEDIKHNQCNKEECLMR